MRLDPKELYFIPLGGAEQFGVNLNAYAYDNALLAIDCGVSFADERYPGIDLLLPDPAFLVERRKSLKALIITHAHEDHIGAVSHLWPRLRCPIYCSQFTAAVLHGKLEENPECREAEVTVVNPGETVQIGPFGVKFVHVAHSIPNTCALILETEAGRVVHSGDWNLDPAPVLGEPTDAESFREAGRSGVAAYVGDSTNAEVDGVSGSERDVEQGLAAVFSRCPGRIAVTVFASNIGRVRSICKAASAAGRQCALIGRSLHRMVGAARTCGYLDDVADFVPEEDIGYMPNDKIVMIVTGSQGEARAQLSRIARGEHQQIVLGKSDTVIFSARPIPGNEREIIAVKNNLAAARVTVISPGDVAETIHVSGHPARDEIMQMFQWVKPESVIPVHGERTMLEAHAALALDCQIKTAIVPNNGSVIRLAPGPAEIVDHIATGLLAVEPGRIISADHAAIVQRRKLQFTGAVHATLAMDARGKLVSDPSVSSVGLIDPDSKEGKTFEEDLVVEIEDILADMTKQELYDDAFVAEEIRIGLRRFCDHILRIKPKVTVHLVRV